MKFRIGQGFDVHAFAEGRKLILGGVEIAHPVGLLGHSDADVLTHALCDALLGAAALGDIGHLFPDTDASYKGADSLLLLSEVMRQVRAKGFELGNADITVIAQAPKLAPHINTMRQNIAAAMQVDVDQIGIKATTTEKLGFTGRREGIATQAVALLTYN
ncbi:MAG: 2-C-methyl-D-erythritol 2,4-cyclodiphosphate synthase [Zetaproteobacteria bacterium CG06_land_8_20_14_3_00_59_53]|nr:MAG: 2-C-methyl-D-erythritol 2,4-cyclodiphosphate synthase [Zetaproteobacteria bacterium CG2_30_59_37]PIO89851.1 MAG: 2-C-methyl-D-erythritol 2,4-cyclodiphosphate synthase [Zetaproteobacteria bacterium CG23_combo_of_CG06-09_8_20_14_all_59_86]PIQ64215.1 MAG: 2-C-methyl-D-erythritol 2,4-cyclodiphosphate synthase [Zetaproteobacteria bacterium CG11_big_fil_rev_8_21_14_0_20_59_439]PIU70439.1 MAG: 2-C-methyl-D-erythritol 2,4-cyclodiphosphate synthase [Zetaproteobacteria bacterium CG06_land_8_20_14_